MRFMRLVLTVAVALALATYASDCLAMTTPEQVMRCCGSMRCMSGSHSSQECCKNMPSQHSTFVQPLAWHTGPHLDVVLAVSPRFVKSVGLDSSTRFVATQSHAPPIFNKSAPLPLRI